jgi:hypothetical protein
MIQFHRQLLSFTSCTQFPKVLGRFSNVTLAFIFSSIIIIRNKAPPLAGVTIYRYGNKSVTKFLKKVMNLEV